MKRLWVKRVVAAILCIVILMPQFVYAEEAQVITEEKEPGPVEKGLSDLLFGMANFLVVKVFNPGNISITNLIMQKTDDSASGLDASNITTIDVDGSNNIKIKLFSGIIGKWYKPLVLLSLIVFMVGLVYIGILTLMSTASAKRAMYTQRLLTWSTGLLMLFAFSYIMVYLIQINNGLAKFFLDMGDVDEITGSVAADRNLRMANAFIRESDGSKGAKISSDSDSLFLVSYFNKNNVSKFIVENDDGSVSVKVDIEKAYVTPTTIDKESQALPVRIDTEGRILLDYNNPFNEIKTNKMDRIVSENKSRLEGWGKLYPLTHDEVFNGKETDNYFISEIAFYVKVNDSDNNQAICLKAKDFIKKTGSKYEYDIEGKEIKRENVKLIKTDKPGKWLWVIPMGWAGVRANAGVYEAAEGKVLPINSFYMMTDGGTGSEVRSGNYPKDAFLLKLYTTYKYKEHFQRIGYAVLYAMGVIQTAWLFIVYFIRVFMVSFLILIFPIIMSIYALDKINDNKSFVFGEWLKQFISNVFTNSVHALSYGIICSVIFKELLPIADDENGGWALFTMVMALYFIIPMGQLLRGIFRLEGAGAASSMAGVGALVGGAMLANQAVGSAQKIAKGFSGGGSSLAGVASGAIRRAKGLPGGDSGSGGGGGKGSGGGGGGSGGGGLIATSAAIGRGLSQVGRGFGGLAGGVTGILAGGTIGLATGQSIREIGTYAAGLGVVGSEVGGFGGSIAGSVAGHGVALGRATYAATQEGKLAKEAGLDDPRLNGSSLQTRGAIGQFAGAFFAGGGSTTLSDLAVASIERSRNVDPNKHKQVQIESDANSSIVFDTRGSANRADWVPLTVGEGIEGLDDVTLGYTLTSDGAGSYNGVIPDNWQVRTSLDERALDDEHKRVDNLVQTEIEHIRSITPGISDGEARKRAEALHETELRNYRNMQNDYNARVKAQQNIDKEVKKTAKRIVNKAKSVDFI